MQQQHNSPATPDSSSTASDQAYEEEEEDELPVELAGSGAWSPSNTRAGHDEHTTAAGAFAQLSLARHNADLQLLQPFSELTTATDPHGREGSGGVLLLYGRVGSTVGTVGKPDGATSLSTAAQHRQQTRHLAATASEAPWTARSAWSRPHNSPTPTAAVTAAVATKQSKHADSQAVDAPAAAAAAGTAAFKAASRSSANKAGRFSTGSAASELPGPGQFRPHHTAVDKHVRSISFAPANSHSSRSKHAAAPGRVQQLSAAAAAHDDNAFGRDSERLSKQQPHQQYHQQQLRASQDTTAHRSSTGYCSSTAATEAARRTSMCTSAAAFTPRSAAADSDGGRLQQQQQQRQQGTAAFKTTTRDQRAAIGAAPTPDGGGYLQADEQQEQQQQPQRSDQCHGTDFSKQTFRPAPNAITASPAALGPGAYFRSGALPTSLTGGGLLAGHNDSSSRPHSSSSGACRPYSGLSPARRGAAAACHHRHGDGSVLAAAGGGGGGGVGDPAGLWAWGVGAAGDAESCAHDQQQQQQACHVHVVQGQAWGASHSSSSRPCSAGPLPVGSASSRPSTTTTTTAPSRPSSAALAYARGQRGTVLVVPADAADDSWLTAAAATCSNGQDHLRHQHQHQHQQPLDYNQQRAARGRSEGRPATAGPCLVHTGRPHTTSNTLRPCSGRSPGPQRSGVRPGTAVMAAAEQRQRQCVSSRPQSSATAAAGERMLGASELQRFSSTGLAARVKGGKFSACSRQAAAAAASAGGGGGSRATSELLYQPKPEVQGHMQRAPGWSLPPNVVETSKKWRELAAHAALQ